MAKQDTHTEAKERFETAMDYWRETHDRIIEDFEFSNPADPRQWSTEAEEMRKGRPCLVFDRTNQFINQVVNDNRQNKPSIKVLPADSGADIHTANALNGLIRYIEYVSRADFAYDTAIECSARGGLGWLRVVPEVIRPETNEQDIRILRVTDPTSIVLDPDFGQPDGSDAMWGFATTRMSRTAFERKYPKAKNPVSWDDSGPSLWGGVDEIVLCEYFRVVLASENRLSIQGPDGGVLSLTEDEYWTLAQQIGYQPPVVAQFKAETRKVEWLHMTGKEVLEQTEFPASYVPLIPVIGDEVWIKGKRYISGLVRKLRSGQQAYNAERSAAIEAVALQPKAPFMAAQAAMEGHDAHWDSLNKGNPSFLPWNHLDGEGNPVPMPQRQAPPMLGAAYVSLGEIAYRDMQGAVGMNRSALGEQSNAVSGRAKALDQREADVGTYHYADNMVRSIGHLGRIVVEMIPRLMDTQRQARILGEDGQQESVTIAPGQGVKREGKKTVQIDPTSGKYDVRVVAGASYTTQRQEAAQGIEQALSQAPAMAPALMHALIGLRDFPDADKLKRMVLALSPPEVQAIANEEEGEPQVPPAMLAEMNRMKQHIAALEAAMEDAGQDVEKLETEKQGMEADKSIEAYRAETERMKALAPAIDPSMVQAIVQQTIAQMLQQPAPMEYQPEPEPMPMQGQMQEPMPMEQPMDDGSTGMNMEYVPPEMEGEFDPLMNGDII